MRSLPGRALFSLFCCALLFFPAGESIGAESLRDKVAQFFGIEFRTLDEKEAKRFHERIAAGDREGADKVLKVYLRKAKKEYEKEGSPTPPVLSGRSSIYVPPWDRFLEHRIRDTKEENLTVLCDVIGNLFNDERKGEGYHLSGLVEMIGRKLEVRYKNDAGSFTGRFLDEYETLSPAGRALIMSGLMINLQEKKGFAYLRQMQRLVEERSNYPLISDCLDITGIIRESRDLYHHLEPDSSTWPLEEYDRQIMKIIGNGEIPVMIRASAANKLLFESGGLINCPQFAREIYELNRTLETDYTTPPIRWWRFHLHNQTARRCGDREILEMAAEHVVEWIDRQKLPPPPGFPPAVMGSNMLSESLKILSMADRDSEARQIAATYVNRHHRLDPDIFLALVEIGDLQLALKMLPGKGEKVISWRGEGLRPKLIARLPAFYQAMNDPALQLQIEAGIPGLMRDAFGDYRPTEKGLLDRSDLLTPLFKEMKNLDIEQQVVIMGGMSKHPTHIATFADNYETYQLNFPLIELYGGAVPGERAFFHRINSWTTRFMAAYYREDWSLCRKLTAELTELNKSQYRRECEGLISRVVSRINPIVLDQLIEEGDHDYKEAARFWKDFATTISTMTRNADWTCRGRACAYARLLEVKAGNLQTFEQWLADIPAPKAERLRRMNKYTPGYLLFLSIISNDPRWSQGPDRGQGFRQTVFQRYFSNLSYLEQEYGDYKTLQEYFKRCFTVKDVLTYIENNEAPLPSRAFWVAALGRHQIEEEEHFKERISLYNSWLAKLADDDMHAVPRKMILLSLAENEARWGSPDKARDWLDKVGATTYEDWIKEIRKNLPPVPGN